MISCKKIHLINRCIERGYTLDEVKECIINETQDGMITVDETHNSYPRYYKDNTINGSGVGTELKKLLSKIGIVATPNCECNKRAKTMDDNGVRWCENNIDTIVGWLREEASKRKLPFIDNLGKLLVRKAITNFKKQIL